jgi:hypothetical protein
MPHGLPDFGSANHWAAGCCSPAVWFGLKDIAKMPQIIIYEHGLRAVAFFDGYAIRLFPNVFQKPLSLIILGLFWLFSSHVSMFGICVQFLYRYLVLNR